MDFLHHFPKQSQADVPPEASGPLALRDLLKHGLLRPVHAAESGGGTLLFLGHLVRCFSVSENFTEWKKEAEKLSTELRMAGATRGSSPSEKDLDDPLWRSVYSCLRAREACKTDTWAIDQLLARSTIHASGGAYHPTQEFFLCLKQLYRSASRNQSLGSRTEWRTLLEVLSNDQPLSAYILKSPAGRRRAFAQTADRLLAAKPLSISTTVTIYSLRCETVVSQTATTPFDAARHDTVHPSPIIDQVNVDEDAPGLEKWRHGDSVSNYLAKHSPYTPRRVRLGIESRFTTALAQLPLIAQNISSSLQQTVEPLEAAACLLALLQTAFPVPASLMLGVRLAEQDDDYVHFDKHEWCFHVRRQHMHATSSGPEVPAWILHAPSVAVSAAKRWLTGDNSDRHVGDLFIKNDFDEEALLKRHHDLLSRCSDSNLQCWPGMWVQGVRTAAVTVMKSELLAAYTLAIPGLTSAGSLYYLHPRQSDLNNAAAQWFEHLGMRHPSVHQHAGV